MTVTSVRELIDLWPSRRELADDLQTTKDRVDKWARALSIPARYHAGILRAALARGFAVSAEDLVRLHDLPSPSQEDAA